MNSSDASKCSWLKRAWWWSGLVVLAVACGGSDGGGPFVEGDAAGDAAAVSSSGEAGAIDGASPGDPLVGGLAQKGPFQEGAQVTIRALDSKGQRIDELAPVRGQMDAFGRYIVDRLPEGVEWAEVVVSGRSFDEMTGDYIQLQGLEMSMLAPVEDGRVRGNINLLTPFARWRALQLCQQGLAEDLTEARQRALVELNAIFGLQHLPDELDLLHGDGNELRAADDATLLRISAALLAANLTGSDYDSLVQDFAQHGAITTPSRLSVLSRWQSFATDDTYRTARENVLAAFGSAPPAEASSNTWIRYGCVPSFGDDSTLCEGDNTFTLPGLSGSGAAFVFRPPMSGSYAISLQQTQNDARHVFELRSGTTVLGQSQGGGTITTPPLHREATYYLSVAPNYRDVPNDYTVRVQRLSDGHPNDPRPLLIGVKHQVFFGRDEGTNNSLYLFFMTAPEPRKHTLVFDNLLIAKLRVELLKYETVDAESPFEVVFDQTYPSSPHALHIDLPVEPSGIYDLRMTLTESEGIDLPPGTPIQLGLMLVAERD